MYGTLADTKLLCCAAHGGSILDDIFAELYGALLNNTFHCSTLQTIPIGNSYAGREKFSTMTAKCGDYAFVGILCTCEPKPCNCLWSKSNGFMPNIQMMTTMKLIVFGWR